MAQMDGVTHKELWMLLGEKDVQIYQLVKHIEKLDKVVEALAPKKPEDPFKGK